MVRFRPLQPSDQSALWDWLHTALWDPPPAGPRPREVLAHPAVRIYAEDWGRPGDLGRVAVAEGVDAGACWMRLLPEGIGLAYVDEATPQLGIALAAGYRGRGIGRRLMQDTLAAAWQAGRRQVSLTVHPQNPAIFMYEACGFARAGTRNGYVLMLASAA